MYVQVHAKQLEKKHKAAMLINTYINNISGKPFYDAHLSHERSSLPVVYQSSFGMTRARGNWRFKPPVIEAS